MGKATVELAWHGKSCKCCKEALCEHKPEQHTTQHTNYTPSVSLKCKTNNKLHAAQCSWGSQQLHSHSANMEQEGSLPCAQQPIPCSCLEQDEFDHVPQFLNLFNIHFNIILPSTPTSLKWFPSFMLYPQDIQLVFQTCFMWRIAV